MLVDRYSNRYKSLGARSEIPVTEEWPRICRLGGIEKERGGAYRCSGVVGPISRESDPEGYIIFE